MLIGAGLPARPDIGPERRGRHQRIALLAPFGLGNDMGVPLGIMPYKLELLAVEHTDEGYATVGDLVFQICDVPMCM